MYCVTFPYVSIVMNTLMNWNYLEMMLEFNVTLGTISIKDL